jgi:hypothetical protein
MDIQSNGWSGVHLENPDEAADMRFPVDDVMFLAVFSESLVRV